MLSKCSLCPPAKGESRRGWARVRDAAPLWGGGEGKAFRIQNKPCVFSQCNSLLRLVHRGSTSGPGQSLLPSLFNHVTASFSYKNVHICKVVPNSSGY